MWQAGILYFIARFEKKDSLNFLFLLCKIEKLRYILCQYINRIIYCKHKSSWHNTVVPKKLIIELFFVECKIAIPMVFVLSIFTACLKHKIKRLVYTSTYNVIFGGQVICDGEESLPYLPLNQVSHC